jgi:membrane-bound lytic murein transglycosylase B
LSVQKFGRDGNGDGRINPFEFDDALFSAANFLIEHGWREDKIQALGRYYGSSNGYPRAILAYAEALAPAQP